VEAEFLGYARRTAVIERVILVDFVLSQSTCKVEEARLAMFGQTLQTEQRRRRSTLSQSVWKWMIWKWVMFIGQYGTAMCNLSADGAASIVGRRWWRNC